MQYLFRFALCTTFALGLTCGFARAAVPQDFSFTVARAPHPLALDANLADPAWAAGKVPDGSGPWQNVTTRAPAKDATTAYLLYDDKNLYVGFKAEQPGVPVVATQTTNDVGFGTDDFVGIGCSTAAAAAKPTTLKPRPAASGTSRPTRTSAFAHAGAPRGKSPTERGAPS